MEIIQFLQQFDYPGLVLLMKTVTFLGDEPFYLLVLPVVFWCWKKELGILLILLLYFTFLLNTGLKEWFAIPRPLAELHWVAASGYGFPSGHAQSAMVLWGYFAWRFKNYGWTAVVIFLIGFSRIYLGVHSPQDVIGGWSIGFVSLLIGITVITRLDKTDIKFPAIPTALVFGVTGGLIAVLYPDEMIIKISGFVAGIGAGFLLERIYVGFNPRAAWWKQILKVIIGIGGALILRLGLKMIFPEVPPLDWLRYGLVGIWVGLSAPWVFKRIGN